MHLDCQPLGSFCCDGSVCVAPRKCLTVGPDPSKSISMCFEAGREYCEGIGVCAKGLECHVVDGKKECVPPEPQDCKEIDCGIYGPHECKTCCPAYSQHAHVWCEQALGWGKAHCECDPGAAVKAKSPTAPSGQSMTLQFTGGTTLSAKVGTSITVTNGSGQSATASVPPGNTSAGCASVSFELAEKVGLKALADAFGKVQIWGSKFDVKIVGECPVVCSTPTCRI